jgi:tRNA U34 5-carboxymethylaminomethyl modifying GTPase MnmE/TrmE
LVFTRVQFPRENIKKYIPQLTKNKNIDEVKRLESYIEQAQKEIKETEKDTQREIKVLEEDIRIYQEDLNRIKKNGSTNSILKNLYKKQRSK